ncbi:hypothetical protein [Desulfopila inferna]|uniref:hypothetical protein n=1 Tax=Desulfopila inferna TaxID=468528 RepID=UPI0019625CCF|nr:hypothetical protein [Desulfopila inferna]MBM9604998.1 hypothetical protein [Desulfopila inferna]
MRKIQIIHISTFFLLMVISGPDNAWALQSHGAPEGNYVHQMAHLLFMVALLYLYWHTRRTTALSSRGWKFLQTFCLVFACWNIVAFLGHEAFESLSSADFQQTGTLNEQIAGPITPVKVIYFLTKMDHLLFVPALWALVISLRTFYHDALREEKR